MDEVKHSRKARAIFKPVDHSEFYLWSLSIPHSSYIKSQGIHKDSGMATLLSNRRYRENGKEKVAVVVECGLWTVLYQDFVE